ncbi:hypothetical protein [Halostagnicola kamekurae]|uniref:Uncharacterized protein n=1 Tax=Halostagnicola kamekurae TaxID=619731 RepID=A0A1I6TLH9_9EURY|nr:hypothetical protein [Halostagnicola kamekurae]SFS89990.1 hypothetical protein SAMN04488556_3205 [Halostagnicola kamekurae]
MWFAGSNAYKWLEAASYVLAGGDVDSDAWLDESRRNELRERVDGVIDLGAVLRKVTGTSIPISLSRNPTSAGRTST